MAEHFFETRAFAGAEVRAVGRSLHSLFLPDTECPAGRCIPGQRERIIPAGLDIRSGPGIAPKWLDVDHDPSRVLAHTGDGSLRLRAADDGLHFETGQLPRLPLVEQTLERVRSGDLRGASVEFRALEERVEDGVRVVERAHLHGIGLVRSPAYEATTVEQRCRCGSESPEIQGTKPHREPAIEHIGAISTRVSPLWRL